MEPELRKKIQKQIEQLEEFREGFDTELIAGEEEGIKEDSEVDDEYYFTYHGIHMGTDVLIMEEYMSPVTYERTFFLYHIATDSLSEATKEEDEFFRMIDDNYPVREWDSVEFIIGKNWKNEIRRR
jgi:hypothetical protein